MTDAVVETTTAPKAASPTLFEPPQEADYGRSAVVRRMLRYMWFYKGRTVLFIILLAAQSICNAIWPRYTGEAYTLLANGSLALNLPGNISQRAQAFSINSSGALNGTVSSLDLTVAGLTLHMGGATLSNSGLIRTTATLETPVDLGQITGSPQSVQITDAGLIFAQNPIPLPDIGWGASALKMPESANAMTLYSVVFTPQRITSSHATRSSIQGIHEWCVKSGFQMNRESTAKPSERATQVISEPAATGAGIVP